VWQVGELGYELHIPCEFAQHVYDRVVEAGKTFDLTHAGLKALGSLRLEKAYRDYGHDMDNMDRCDPIPVFKITLPCGCNGACV
jgi:glycine cleavage system aminomethyltransferase T